MPDIQKDLVLSPNEYAYVLDETKGNIACNVGPHKMSLSQSDVLVRFDATSKAFVECASYEEAIQLFTTVPEGWYVALKNPAPANKHPQAGTSNSIPEGMEVGRKINIPGPASFALYPGQMAQVIKGHTLRSNQYLVAIVYDAETLNKEINADTPRYFNGQKIIIKGTETTFFIPKTGMEVEPTKDGYMRDAVTLERLEYCILKDEDGNKRYVTGPAVVFPSSTEVFLKDSITGNIKRKAIELSDISGVYVKVIADYTDEKGLAHKAGEELFITGKDQMIYYPRPEHTFITYEGQIVTHAIAIPEGEGRYIMNRLTGEIKTIIGPAMYLPDPRWEVVVKRTLSRSQCELWYPNNKEVLEANGYIDDTPFISGTWDTAYDDMSTQLSTYSTNLDSCISAFYPTTSAITLTSTCCPTQSDNSNISRGNSFTPPRSISFNKSKYEGAVAIDVWTGYAVSVISKNGARRIITGPETVLLGYDETLEVLEVSTGLPKNVDKLEKQVFLPYLDNQIVDVAEVETKDRVKAKIKVAYYIKFRASEYDRWFDISNYVKYVCDYCRDAIKREVKDYSIVELYDNYQTIIMDALTDPSPFEDDGGMDYHYFELNGMAIDSVEVLNFTIAPDVQSMIEEHNRATLTTTLNLASAQATAETEKQILELNKEKIYLKEQNAQYKAKLEAETKLQQEDLKDALQQLKDENNKRQLKAEQEIQELSNAIAAAELEKTKREQEADREHKQKILEIAAAREKAAAENASKVFESIGPELAAALNAKGNQDIMEAISGAISPYAMANGESVSDTISKLLRGTTLENILEVFKNKDT